jgi:hypothetical protein
MAICWIGKLGGSVTGVQTSFGLNFASALIVDSSFHMSGVQIAGLGNIADSVNGIQIAGLANGATNVNGIQSAILFNFCEREMNGIQMAIINKSDHVTGVQIGLVNHAKRLQGVQVGLLNFNGSRIFPGLMIGW